MSKWTFEYWTEQSGKSSVEKWLDKLEGDRLNAVTKELRLLGMCGNELRLPHSRSLGGGLFELRERRYGFRVYYCFDKGKIIVLLAAGDKNTQRNDIKVARERLAAELRGEG